MIDLSQAVVKLEIVEVVGTKLLPLTNCATSSWVNGVAKMKVTKNRKQTNLFNVIKCII